MQFKGSLNQCFVASGDVNTKAVFPSPSVELLGFHNFLSKFRSSEKEIHRGPSL